MSITAKNSYLPIALLLLALCFQANSQVQNEGDCLINGYASKIAGDDYIYHSPIPQAEESMIVRATDGNYLMEWITDTIPQSVKEKFISISWLAGIGSSPGLSEMKLTINDTTSFIFFTDGRSDWNIKNSYGSELSFHAEMTDQHGDKFGFMNLRVPNSPHLIGKPLHLKVTGGDFGKTSWYMTFKMPVKTHVNLKVFPALLKSESKNNQLVSGGILYRGDPDTLYIYAYDELVKKQAIQSGYNYLRFGIPEVKRKWLLH
jgi:alpha-mannosidase